MTKLSPKTKKAPMAALRQRLFVSRGQRPRHTPNLWLAYSARMKREWVLCSDLAYLHFLSIEFAPDVHDFDLSPVAVSVLSYGVTESVEFDAVVGFRDGHKECREFCAPDAPPLEEVDEHARRMQAAAAILGGDYVRLSIEVIEVHRQRIQNTLRMLRFISAARNESLVDARNEVLVYLRASPTGSSLEELAKRIVNTPTGILYAAVFRLLQQGQVEIDFDRDVVTGMSTVRAVP